LRTPAQRRLNRIPFSNGAEKSQMTDQVPASRGFSKTRIHRMDDVMAGYVERGTVPGVVSLVSRRGETHVDAVGKRSIDGERGGDVGRDTIFRISSMTKPIIALAAMILVEECKLRLDERVDRLLPELADRKVLRRWNGPLDDVVPADRPITVRDLLTFSMGWGQPMVPPDSTPIQREKTRLRLGQGPPAPATPPTPDEWIRAMGGLPLMHQPGERWMYSTGSDVLGVLIARASGEPFEEFLRERIFDPLGMRDTGFSVPGSKMGRFTTAYWTNQSTGALEVYDDAEKGQWSRPPQFPSGAAGLVSTVDDYLAFAQMMMNGGELGEVRLVSRPSVELMTTDQLTREQKAVSGLVGGFFDGNGWGFGVSIVTRRDGPSALGSYGWSGGLGSIWQSDPKEGLIAVLMSNASWTSPAPPDICLDFLTSAYQAMDD
jgi:CubicO group peptidase (beta-lactamase class C family)